MQTSLNEIYQAIGSLTSEVTGLRRDLHAAEALAHDSNKSAAKSRSEMYGRLEEAIERTTALEHKVEAVQKDMVSVKEVTQQVMAWKQAGIGALGVTGMASSAITATFVAYWAEIKRVLWGG